MTSHELKVLIASVVRQEPRVLEVFLAGLKILDTGGLAVDFLFVDNNEDPDSSFLLENFTCGEAGVFLARLEPDGRYVRTEKTHVWSEEAIWKVAAMKDFILQYALERDYSHVFLVDSDLVLHPLTLKQLLSAAKDIIAEIFWTEWMPGMGRLPQVWVCGQYSFHHGGASSELQEQEAAVRGWLDRLKEPGVYEVGGLGACTLISREAISKGANYQRIDNVDYWGEDRHFCIRARVLGFRLYVDTHYPAYHIYRDSDLAGAVDYLRQNVSLNANNAKIWKGGVEDKGVRRRSYRQKGTRLTLSMIVRNEANRYLLRVLEHARDYIDAAVIIDDASEDETPQICREILKEVPLTLVRLEESLFSNEFELRQLQWKATTNTNPDWILVLDADEVFEDRVVTDIESILEQREFDVICFRIFDFWDELHYREDRYWQAHLHFYPLLIRYDPNLTYRWKETPVHCGRLPSNITQMRAAASSLRVKHLGWARPEDRIQKYRRYMKADPDGRFGSWEQYQSILDPHPRLVKWIEQP